MTNAKKTLDVEVAHTFTASAERVYRAWLDPLLVQKWFGPSLGETLPVEIDAKIGGKFRIVQVRDGESVGHSGEYIVLERPHHISFTWATDDDEGYSEVHVQISSVDGGSSVRLVHIIDEQWKEYVDKTRQAWAAMLTEIDTLLR